MSRIKSRQNTDLCADCGATEPTWVSVNKGIYLCAECCSVHRSFGRHISQVKSIQKSIWHPTLLTMVQTLNNNGVNNIWEHLLLDNTTKLSKRKPQPKDPLHPVKAEFILAKHQQYMFVFRPSRDDTLCTESELGKQLHSSVRTANLETSLKLLIQGADPNYFHDEKGTTPLHVAAKANQMSQVELLIVYGADPNSPDAHGINPIEYAKLAGNNDLADRLVQCLYEVTDRLTYYVCGKKPDHKQGKHFLIPEDVKISDTTVISKLQKLASNLFEKLITDVYDEIDRRETEAIWMSSSDSLELTSIPFLPVDPSYSATRNQGRQKLARFTASELKQLVSDLLNEIRRRQLPSSAADLKHLSRISDDEPLYDSVASDEDYAILPSTQSTADFPIKKDQNVNTLTSLLNSPSSVEILTKKLLKSDSMISELRAEVRVLQSMVKRLSSENTELRSRLSQTNSSINGNETTEISNFIRQVNSAGHDHNFNKEKKNYAQQEVEAKLAKRNQRPTSMYETREGFRTPNWQMIKNQKCEDGTRMTGTQSLYGVDSKMLEQKLTKCTENVTHCIHELWRCIQGPNINEGCIPGANKIHVAVSELTTIVPPGPANEDIKLLLERTSQLQIECTKLQQSVSAGEGVDLDYYMQKVRCCAYDIAKATKTLVTKFINSPRQTFENEKTSK